MRPNELIALYDDDVVQHTCLVRVDVQERSANREWRTLLREHCRRSRREKIIEPGETVLFIISVEIGKAYSYLI